MYSNFVCVLVFISYNGDSAINTLPSAINLGVNLYSIDNIKVSEWNFWTYDEFKKFTLYHKMSGN